LVLARRLHQLAHVGRHVGQHEAGLESALHQAAVQVLVVRVQNVFASKEFPPEQKRVRETNRRLRKL
jgi:hypothetical protein